MFVEHHATAVCKAGLYHLRNISRVRRYTSRHTAEILMLLLSPVWDFVTRYFQDGKGEGGEGDHESRAYFRSNQESRMFF